MIFHLQPTDGRVERFHVRRDRDGRARLGEDLRCLLAQLRLPATDLFTDNWSRMANLASGCRPVSAAKATATLNSAVKRRRVRLGFMALTKIAAINCPIFGEYYINYLKTLSIPPNSLLLN